MRQPKYFVGIGAQRAGTTWLGEYLTSHPQVSFSPIKELHFFDTWYRPDLCSVFNTHFLNQFRNVLSKRKPGTTSNDGDIEDIWLELRIGMIESREKYKEYFDLLQKRRGGKITGEITPSYSLLDQTGFKAIKDIYPDARIIFILRNPCDRYWSHLKFHEGRIAGFKADEQAIRCLENPQYHLRTDYGRTITALLKIFPENQVLISFFEDLFCAEAMDEELKRITSFLGIDFRVPDSRPVNESMKKPLPDQFRKRFFQHFDFVYRYISQLFNGKIPGSWLNDMKSYE